MKNLKNTILAHIGGNIAIGNTGWTTADALEATAATLLDANRFGDEVTAVLSRHEDCESEARYPSSDELSARGIDVVVLANASVNGLDMDVFGRALEAGLDGATLTKAIDLGLDPEAATDLLERYEADEVSGMLANYVESTEEVEANPDPVLRTLARLGETDVELMAA